MKYKVGDEVRVITDDNCGYGFGYQGFITSVFPFVECEDTYEVDNEYLYSPREIEAVQRRTRGFQVLPGYKDTPLPTRATKYSAGYDLAVTEDILLSQGETKVYTTGLCAYMLSDEYLAIHVRSSLGIKYRITLANSTGIVDADYVQSDNGGHIMLALTNNGDKVFRAAKGDRVAQGIFQKYLVADDDNVTTERNGGWGSTGN